MWTKSKYAAPLKWLMWLASFALVIMMLLVAVDVVARNLGLFYILGVTDYTSLALIMVAGFAFAWGFVENRHLVVEIGTYGLSEAHKSRLEGLWLILGSVVLIYLAYMGFFEGLHLAERGKKIGVAHLSPALTHSLSTIGFGSAGVAALVVGLGKMTLRYKKP